MIRTPLTDRHAARPRLLLGLVAVVALLMTTTGCGSGSGVESPTAPVASPATPAPEFSSALGSASFDASPGRFSSPSSGSSDSGDDSGNDSDPDSDGDSDLDDDSDFDSGNDSGNDSGSDSGDDSSDDSGFDSDDDTDSDSGSSNRGNGGGNSGPGSNNSGPGSDNSGGGDQRVESDRFRGRVSAVDAPGGSLMLSDGFVVVVDAGTFWRNNSDLFSLFDIADAVAAGKTVRVEGEGSFAGSGIFEVTEIRARTRGRSDDPGSIGDSPADFEARILFADRAGRTLQLANGLTLTVDASTVWNPLGDLFSVRQVARALDRGRFVRVEGGGSALADGTVLASAIKVEVDD